MAGRKSILNASFDHVVVGQVVSGQPVTGVIDTGSIREIVRILATAGFSDGQIAYRVGCTRRTVARHRTALSIEAPCKGLSGLTRPVHNEPTVTGY